ncbi:GCN5-related N-acetyltransferase [Azoarcus olearius]|uniref:arsenic resistance N-acetyltransferase ArsN2 n=1 Tax=Azoarcus sp. (strain BH72) TaxID=418699 RepID=UPI0008061AF1|nr:arsenic resistance N-acetyltransferase ArsN2 [Azoarcus olearius]ANQ86873.1 GCN5-related N-acetyltransferase [Azoarcus olearius]
MHITRETAIDDVIALLSECGLPVQDISASSHHLFFGLRDHGALVGAVGLEPYAKVGLLRSLAVAPAYRGRGLGEALVRHVEAFSASHGVEDLFLLTSTAEHFFATLGYRRTPRSDAPEAIRATAQFAGLCPCSAAFMSKPLIHGDAVSGDALRKTTA